MSNTSVYQEHELAVGECLVIQRISGEYVVLAIRAIGEDIDGDRVTEIELWAEDGNELKVALSDGEPLRVNFWDSNGQLISSGYSLDRTPMGDLDCTGWPGFWYQSRFFFGQDTRRDVFLPAFNELLEDHCHSRLKARRKQERLYVNLQFSVRTLRMLSECLYAEFTSTRIPNRYMIVAFFTVPGAAWSAAKLLKALFL